MALRLASISLRRSLAQLPAYLEREDILQALRYAAWRVDDRESCCLRNEDLIDMNLSTRWVTVLDASGISSTHRRSLFPWYADAAGGMLRTAESAELRAIGSEARRIATESYGIEGMSRNYEALYWTLRRQVSAGSVGNIKTR